MSKILVNEHGERMFVRFSVSQRIEHAVQAVGFIMLVITGIAQRYNESPISEAIILGMGGIEMVRTIHRFFGVMLIVQSVYHIGWLAYVLATKKTTIWAMLPNMKDGKDAMQMVLYFLGLRKEKAKFDRYDFRQKVEYLALVWGTIVMVVTGLMMWFPLSVTAYLPGESIVAAKAAHGGEGLLAFLSILIWHMYSAHLQQDVFPFDYTIFTGKISEERMIHEHPLEWERIVAAERAAGRPIPDSSGHHHG